MFISDMDDEHKEIFQSLGALQAALSVRTSALEIVKLASSVNTRIEDHFAHEERLMRAARYGSFAWHKRLHDAARRRTREYLSRIQREEGDAGQLIDYLARWLHNHTRLADMMLGAFLRNHRLSKMTFRAGTKPMDACQWLDSEGERFDPAARNSGY